MLASAAKTSLSRFPQLYAKGRVSLQRDRGDVQPRYDADFRRSTSWGFQRDVTPFDADKQARNMLVELIFRRRAQCTAPE